MGLKIVVPRSLATLGAWLDLLVLQDVLDRLTTDPGDTKAPEFTKDLGIAEAGLLGDLDHKVSQHLALAMRLSSSRLAVLGLSSPAVEGAGSHDRDQLRNGRVERQSELKQPLALFGPSVNLARDPLSQNLILLFEITDLAAEMTGESTGNECQERVKQLGHGTWLV